MGMAPEKLITLFTPFLEADQEVLNPQPCNLHPKPGAHPTPQTLNPQPSSDPQASQPPSCEETCEVI